MISNLPIRRRNVKFRSIKLFLSCKPKSSYSLTNVLNVKLQKSCLPKHFCFFIQENLISKNAVKLGVSGHFRIRPIIHISHTTPFLEQHQKNAVKILARQDFILLFERNQHGVNKIESYRERGLRWHF